MGCNGQGTCDASAHFGDENGSAQRDSEGGGSKALCLFLKSHPPILYSLANAATAQTPAKRA